MRAVSKLRIAFFVCWAGSMIGLWVMNSFHVAAGKFIGTAFGTIGIAIAGYLLISYLRNRFWTSD
jgi:hypothetical protein